MHKGIAFSWLLSAAVIICTFTVQTKALPYSSKTLWNQFQEDYPEAAQELLERVENVVQMRELDNAKRNMGAETTDLGFSRTRNTRPLLMKFLGFGLKRSDLSDLSNFSRRRRSDQA